jgi:hypothetical protein
MDSRVAHPFQCGLGTLLTNDFRNCDPQGGGDFDPVSLVCKLNDANGKPAVKLSDNFQKALGPREEIQRYQLVFGLAGVAHAPVVMSWQRGSGTAFEEIGARAAFSTTTFPRSGLLARSNFWIARHSDAIERHTYWRHEQAPDRAGARDHRIIQCSSLHVKRHGA